MKFERIDELGYANAAASCLAQCGTEVSFRAREAADEWTHGERASLPAFARHSPRQNGLLAALPAADYDRLLPHLELSPLQLGWTVYRPGQRVAHMYFPTAGVVSRQHMMEDGSATASAIMGNEGLVGIPALMGGESPFEQLVVQGAGFAYRVRADVLRAEFNRGGALQHLLLRYIHALLAQMGRSAACNGHHSIEQRYCRWLLLSLDRMSSNCLTMTQQRLADFLGVRRESVAATERSLHLAGLARSRRGALLVRERAGLEARVCECYRAEQAEFRRLLPGRMAFADKRSQMPELV